MIVFETHDHSVMARYWHVVFPRRICMDEVHGNIYINYKINF